MTDLGASGDHQLLVADGVSRLRLQLLRLGIHLCHRRAGLEVDACAAVAAQVLACIAQSPWRMRHVLLSIGPAPSVHVHKQIRAPHSSTSCLSFGLTLLLVPLGRLLLAAAADAGVEARQARSCTREIAWLQLGCCTADQAMPPVICPRQLQIVLAGRRTIWQQVRLAEGWALV